MESFIEAELMPVCRFCHKTIHRAITAKMIPDPRRIRSQGKFDEAKRLSVELPLEVIPSTAKIIKIHRSQKSTRKKARRRKMQQSGSWKRELVAIHKNTAAQIRSASQDLKRELLTILGLYKTVELNTVRVQRVKLNMVLKRLRYETLAMDRRRLKWYT